MNYNLLLNTQKQVIIFGDKESKIWMYKCLYWVIRTYVWNTLINVLWNCLDVSYKKNYKK